MGSQPAKKRRKWYKSRHKSKRSVVKSTRIMNEDVVMDVMNYLDLKQLFAIQRVSNQFRFCAQYMLRTVKGLRIGSIATPRRELRALGTTGNTKSIDGINCGTTLREIEMLAQKCANVELLLINMELSTECMVIFANNCPKINRLCFESRLLLAMTERRLCEIGNSFGDRIRHLVLNYSRNQLSANVKTMALVSSFPRLTLLYVRQYEDFENVINSVPNCCQSIQLLNHYIWYSAVEFQLFLAFINRSEATFQYLQTDYAYSRDDLKAIAKKSDLKMFTINCTAIKTIDCFETIATQKKLHSLSIRKLYIESVDTLSSRRLKCFPSIKCLSLKNCFIHVSKFKEFLQYFPTVSLMYMKFITFGCNCLNVVANVICKPCAQKCHRELSALKRLTRLSMSLMFGRFDTFDGFPALRTLEMLDEWMRYEKLVEIAKKFCAKHCDRNLELRLRIDPKFSQKVRDKLAKKSPTNLNIKFNSEPYLNTF